MSPTLEAPWLLREDIPYIINISETLMDLWAIDGFLTKDDVPEVFHHSACSRIAQRGFHQPAVEPHVMCKRSFQDLISRHGKLRAAGNPDLFGNGSRVEQFRPCLSKGPLSLCLVFIYSGLLFLVAKWLNLCWIATWSGMTSEVRVPVLLHKIDIEQLQRFRSVLIVVPGAEMTVYKCDCFRQLAVVLDDIAEVYVGLSSLVSRRM